MGGHDGAWATGGGCGGVAHDASSAHAIAIADNRGYGMGLPGDTRRIGDRDRDRVVDDSEAAEEARRRTL